jgi:penicillin-binding protein 1C
VVLLLAGAALLFSGSAPGPAEVRQGYRPSEARLLARDGQVLQEIRIDPTVRRLAWQEYGQISPAFFAALISNEDRRFYQHRGVDWLALARAGWDTISGHPRGGSTLTMQLARLLEAGPSNLYLNKLSQIRTALAIERKWSKTEILEAYANLASYGGELEGISAASAHYFGKQASGLSSNEAALLVAILPAPSSPLTEKIARAQRIVGPSAEFDHAAQTFASPAGIARPVQLAPHLANWLLSPEVPELTTTLHAELQQEVGQIVSAELGRLGTQNVQDAAVVVLDNASGAVLAYWGGDPNAPAGLVDGVRALRQPGSALKPFAYGVAFEKRLLTPAALLDDSPLELAGLEGTYAPVNYDLSYQGLVSARQALAGSLNIPAVRTLMLISPEVFAGRLQDFGLASVNRSGDYYGYSLVLGSAEVSLLELTNAYRALARGGLYSPAVFTTQDQGEQRVLSPQAAFLISDILSDPAARAGTFGLTSPLATPFWSAVKTGTSKDMRDNWAVGYSQSYTVGVWVGNKVGTPMHQVSGVAGAAPIWAQVMRVLHTQLPSRPPTPPAGLVRLQVHYAGGEEPDRYEWFLAGTETAEIRSLTTSARAQITYPPAGTQIALDPDIPSQHQKVVFKFRPSLPRAELQLDGQRLASPVWTPEPGKHRLELWLDGSLLAQSTFRVF